MSSHRRPVPVALAALVALALAAPAAAAPGSSLSAFARGGGSGATNETWDASWGAMIFSPNEAPPAPTPKPEPEPRIIIAGVRVAGRSVHFSLRMTRGVGASFSASVLLRGQRVSNRIKDEAIDTEGRFTLKLDRRAAAAARRHGQLVVRAIPWNGTKGLIRLVRPLAR